MTVQTVTEAGQAFAEQLMQDICTIAGPSGPPVFDATTGAYTTPAGVTLYTGKCRVKPQNVQDRTVTAGERPVQVWPYVVSVPVTVVDIPVDATVTVTASADADLVGQVLTVKDVTRGTDLTARRLSCVDQET